MKKLMLVAAFVLCGAIAQAGAVNWSVNAIQGPGGASAAAGWLVQVYAASVAYSYDAAKAGSIVAWDEGATISAGTTFRAADSGTQTDGTTTSYYAVIYDAATVAAAQNYIVSDNVSVTAPATGALANLPFGAMTATTTANKFLNSSWTSTGGTPIAEPTSGLLMLLGVAGLALRRRRA